MYKIKLLSMSQAQGYKEIILSHRQESTHGLKRSQNADSNADMDSNAVKRSARAQYEQI